MSLCIGQPKYSRLEKFDEATVEVEYSVGNMQQEQRTMAEHEGASCVKACLRGCVILSEYPRQLIMVKVDVERDDGSVLAAAINACVLALLDAGISMYLTPVAMSFAKIAGSSEFLADPIKSEEAASTLTFLFSQDQSNELLMSQCLGSFTMEEVERALVASAKGTCAIRSFFRKVLEQSISFEPTDAETIDSAL
jgi:ribonuclease PH